MSVQRLDRKSGQVYEEQAMAPALSFSMGPSWVHESPFCSVDRDARNERGSPSLKESAMEQLVLCDQRNLTPDLFRHIPWRIASSLWDYLGRRQRRTLYMWKLFAKAYPAQFRGAAKYRSMRINQPQMPLRDYWSVVESNSLSWRLVLALTTSFGRVPELVEIANIKNLIALQIATPLPVTPISDNSERHVAGLNDRIARTWSELAESSGAFTHLRVLRLYCQPDLSPVGIRYLSALPGLCLIIAHECPNLKSCLQVESLDKAQWEVTTIPQFVATEGDRLNGSEPRTLYQCYQRSFHPSSDGQVIEEGILDRGIPILDFRIGQEVSQGSSSSTIYFQRKKASGSRPPEPALKKLKLAGQSPETSQPRSGPRKPVMRKRDPRDLRAVLGDFL